MNIANERYRLMLGDCLAVMKSLPDNSVDSIVTDPPYGLSFMGKKWDYDVPTVEVWAECLRILKPGGHLLSFAGTRTQHRMAVNIEDAGFEIRDMIAWAYGSGFPKSMNVSKAIDKVRDDSADVLRVTLFMADAAKQAGISRADVDAFMGTSDMAGWWLSRLQHRCQCPTWEQWLQLKQFLRLNDKMDDEVWRLNGRKGQPGEAWANAEVVAVDHRMNEPSGIVSAGRDCRVEVERKIKAPNSEAARQWEGWGTALKPSMEPITLARKPLIGTVAHNVLSHGTGAMNVAACSIERKDRDPAWPANIIHDGGAADLFGEASRFFYCAKTSKQDRDHGNIHPTVKPTDLMAYLCRLVTPPGGIVLDPFMGSGSTGKAATREGFQFLGIEREEQYLEIAKARIAAASNATSQE